MPDTNFVPLSPSIMAPVQQLGPATVTGVLWPEVEVEIDGIRVMARLAMAGFYQPVEGDVLLVMTSGAGAFAIGVLSGTGPMTVVAPQDLRLWAPNGCIELIAESLAATAEDIEFNADRFGVVARRVRETFDEVHRVVRGLFDFEAAEVVSRVKDSFAVFCRRFRASADEDVKIDGSRIDLG